MNVYLVMEGTCLKVKRYLSPAQSARVRGASCTALLARAPPHLAAGGGLRASAQGTCAAGN